MKNKRKEKEILVYRKDSELSATQIHSTQPFFMTPNMSTCDSYVLDTRNLYLRQNPI